MPTTKLADAESSIRAAEEVGVEQAPQARLHLGMARQEIEKAKAFVEEGDEAKAERALNRARHDADLALELAHEHRVKKDLGEAQEEIAALKRRLETETIR